MSATDSSALALGVLIPCRNEQSVIGRKLANLALARWPTTHALHRICVVNDGSTDGTEDRAREARAEFFGTRCGVEVSVVNNDVRPGKSGAIECGLRELKGVDIVVLSDADVILHPAALVRLSESFACKAVGMVSGSQCFVQELADDGSVRGPGGAPLLRAGNLFDRATAIIRRVESRFGRLFSVHGQLLGWRACLGITPSAGVAADDIDLALSVRSLGARVCLCPAAQFFEVKTDARAEGGAQELRRARAYLQVMRLSDGSIGRNWLDRMQWWFYRFVPIALPELSVYLPATVLAVLIYTTDWQVCLGGLALFGLFLISPAGRELYRVAGIIKNARACERNSSLSDSWEMERL